MKKIIFALAMMFAAAPATASTYIIYTNNGGTGGTGGRIYSGGSGAINVQITAWQVNQSTGLVNSALLGSYSGGLGVTGTGDNGGAGGLHQFDNVGGYTDFALLQFDQAVTLDYLYLNSYYITGFNSRDNDFATYALDPTNVAWNSDIDLTGTSAATSFWTTVWNSNGGASGWYDTNNNAASNLWLVAAGPNTYNNDGFKLAKIKVTTAPVPEPATWMMMLLGFGTMGMAVKRNRRKSILAFA